MLNHCDTSEGPPCRHMENFLQSTADGSANRLTRWYALAHRRPVWTLRPLPAPT